MNKFGQIAVLLDSNEDYLYYYQLDEERVVRITEDGVAQINPYWDEDVLTSDMIYLAKNRGFKIEYMDTEIVEVYLTNDFYRDEFECEDCIEQIDKTLNMYKEAKNDTN